MKRLTFMLAMANVLCAGADTARMTVLAVDEISGEPVSSVKVSGWFDQNAKPWASPYLGKGSPEPIVVRAQTDESGRCEVEATTPTGKASVIAEQVPSGYYVPCGCGILNSKGKNWFGTWQPDDMVVTMKLQRVQTPIPLWVKQMTPSHGNTSPDDRFASTGNRPRLDLVKGAWLPPLGDGEIADVEFVRLPHEDLGEIVRKDGVRGHMCRDVMEVRFLGQDNGLVEVPTLPHHRLRIRTAPESGYEPDYRAWTWSGRDLQYRSSRDENKCFCFRIRTVRDSSGRLVSGFYGKIYGDIYFLHTEDFKFEIGDVSLQYYLNPKPLDRNLEWSGENLCDQPGWLNAYGF